MLSEITETVRVAALGWELARHGRKRRAARALLVADGRTLIARARATRVQLRTRSWVRSRGSP